MTQEEVLFLKSVSGKVNDSVRYINVEAVFKIASNHNVLPLCYENISSAPGFDAEAFKGFQKKIFSIVFSQTKRTENFRKIYKTLLNNNLKPIVLKGIICRQLYGELCDHRPSGDEDILIKKEEYFALSNILKENGYIPEEEITSKALNGIEEITFKSPNGLNIEVHLNIIGTENKIRRKMNKYFENAFRNAVIMEIDGQEYYTLDYTENYIYLFYHMLKHFSTTGIGIRQIVDMFKFGQAYRNSIDWEKVYDAVESLNAHKLYGDMVEIGNRYLGFSMENKYGITQPDRLIDDMFSSGAYGNGTLEQMGSKVKVMAAIENDGKNSRLRMVFPTIKSMREHYKVLYDHPYLLPVMWIVRIVRYVFRLNTGKTYNVLKSEEIADNKIQLLKDYNII
ncbi:MAG: nucleotidyltransferase family protein [Clostridia bacterium]